MFMGVDAHVGHHCKEPTVGKCGWYQLLPTAALRCCTCKFFGSVDLPFMPGCYTCKFLVPLAAFQCSLSLPPTFCNGEAFARNVLVRVRGPTWPLGLTCGSTSGGLGAHPSTSSKGKPPHLAARRLSGLARVAGLPARGPLVHQHKGGAVTVKPK